MNRLVYSEAFGRAVLGPVARWGYGRHRRTGRTPDAAYRAMRKLYGAGSGRGFRRLVDLAATEHPRLDLPADPPGLAAGQVDEVVAALETDGYAVLAGRLDEASCAELETAARRARCTLVGPITETGAPGGTVAGPAVWDEAAPLARRYEVPEHDVVAVPAAQRVVADASLLAVADRYLGATPIQDLVTMWWSVAAGDDAAAADVAAQQFHFDLDRLRFLKVFVYLTDVDEQTGPHVYVRGSHRSKPPQLRHDGRHSDASVSAAFPGAAVEIAGPRGTVFLADTVGLHKGLPLRRGHRLVFQVEYATSLFGAPFTSPVLDHPGPELREAARRHPAVYQRFELSGR